MTKLNLPTLTSEKGNTLAEYVLIAFCGVGLCLVGWLALGNQLNLEFLGFKTQTANQIGTSSSLVTQHARTARYTQISPTALYNAVLYGNNNTTAIQVTAANGDTQLGLFLSSFNTNPVVTPMILTPSQIKAIERDMSNRTYLIVALERQMIGILKYANNNSTAFMNTNTMIAGQSVSAMNLAIAIQTQVDLLLHQQAQLQASNASAADLSKMSSLVSMVTGDAAAIYSATQTLQAQYLQTLTQSTTNNAVVASKNAAAKAAQTAAQTGSTTSNAVASTTTSATGMCTTGQGISTGTTCTP